MPDIQPRHLSSEFEEELDELRRKLLRMASQVESLIVDALAALAQRDTPRAESVVARDSEVDRLEKEIDEPRYITAERLAPYQPRGTEVGVVLDLMIHDIGIVLALVKSPIAKIDSVGVTVLSKSEDIANARIQFQNGCVANLSASRMSTKKAREIRIFQGDAYLSLDFMNQAGHLVKKTDIIAYGLKMKIGLVKAGDLSAIPVREIPIEKGEPLALELAHFVESVAKVKQPKVGAALGKSALEVAITITEQIRAAGK